MYLYFMVNKETNMNITSTYKYTRQNEKGTDSLFVGYIVAGSLDTGDYGSCELIDLELPNEEVLYSVPVNKLVEINRSEYCDYTELQYGIEMVR